uniref:Uncharacterized protein n=1 Tax=Cupriavidus taiwanensis TaxID=164546 RepID=A0A375HAP6_9BURK|nr:protein of unknown function [Cupriavidus taiwanensis]
MPGILRIAEVDLDVGRDSEALVTSHLRATIPSQRFVLFLRQLASVLDQGVDYSLGVLAGNLYQHPLPTSLFAVFAGTSQEGNRVLRTSTNTEVVDHARLWIEGASRIGSDVHALGLAGSRVEHYHRRLVSMQSPCWKYEALVRFIERFQRRANTPGPGSQCGARRVYARAGVDRLLPVVWEVIHEAADQRVRDQASCW